MRMRNYSKISPYIWLGETGRECKKLGWQAQLLMVYLVTSPQANMMGVYHMPPDYISHNTCIPREEMEKAIQDLCNIGFCSFDPKTEYIWVHNMGYYQIEAKLQKSDNRVKAVNRIYRELPDLAFLGDIFDKYGEDFHMENRRENRASAEIATAHARLLEGPSMPLQGQEHAQKHECEQELKQEQNQEQKKSLVVPIRPHSPPRNLITEQFAGADTEKNITSEIHAVFEHWKTVMNQPEANLCKDRKALINAALSMGYRVEQLKDAITGCSLTPYNMGSNEQGERYDALRVILKDADQIDRFIRNKKSPPRVLTKAERFTEDNRKASKRAADKILEEERARENHRNHIVL